MDEGHLSDSHGKRVDFRNTLLVLTSNLGAGAQPTSTQPEAYPGDAAILARPK